MKRNSKDFLILLVAAAVLYSVFYVSLVYPAEVEAEKSMKKSKDAQERFEEAKKDHEKSIHEYQKSRKEWNELKRKIRGRERM